MLRWRIQTVRNLRYVGPRHRLDILDIQAFQDNQTKHRLKYMFENTNKSYWTAYVDQVEKLYKLDKLEKIRQLSQTLTDWRKCVGILATKQTRPRKNRK